MYVVYVYDKYQRIRSHIWWYIIHQKSKIIWYIYMYLKFITFPKGTKCLGDHTTPPPFNLRQIVNHPPSAKRQSITPGSSSPTDWTVSATQVWVNLKQSSSPNSSVCKNGSFGSLNQGSLYETDPKHAFWMANPQKLHTVPFLFETPQMGSMNDSF